MPLIKSVSKKALKKNIGELIASGRPPDQAAAIAYDVQHKAKKGKLSRPKHQKK